MLVGLGFNVLLSWWWADPIASLILIPFFIKEGRENFFGDHDEDEDEHETDRPRVCFCLNWCFGILTCRAACCLR